MARTDSATRVLDAAPAAVFAALVDADALAAWLPPAGMTGRFEGFDPRPGGAYRMVLSYGRDAPGRGTGKTTSDADVVDARFVGIRPHSLVSYDVDFVSDDPAMVGTMRISWMLEPAGAGTRVKVRADDVPAGISAEDHAAGLASSLDNLAAYLASPAGASPAGASG